MTPGAVNLKVVGDRVAVARRCLAQLHALRQIPPNDFPRDARNGAAAESFLRRSIEALFDVARHLLAKGYGLAGLEYREVARLSIEHGVVTDSGLQERLLRIAGFRNRLTHYYDEVTPEELRRILEVDLEDLEAFARELEAAATRLAR